MFESQSKTRKGKPPKGKTEQTTGKYKIQNNLKNATIYKTKMVVQQSQNTKTAPNVLL